ncbi:MAG: ABC transporter ATP-binding protein [Sarcina sp.]
MSLIEYKNLRVSFKTNTGYLKAVDNISFEINEGEILGIVGESGCGKSVTAMSLVRLLNNGNEKNIYMSGEILYNGQNVFDFTQNQMQHLRGKEISIIYQDPQSALNPVYTIGQQIVEGILIHEKISKRAARKMAIEMLLKVGIKDADKMFNAYPSELSGGMRQRAIIAMALSLKPKVLIADEPTTALDVTVQAQILELLREIQKEFNMTIIVITHDLGVVAELCDRVMVMYAGKVVEEADVYTIFDNPKHPYTKGLLASRPSATLDFEGVKELETIKGNIPVLYEMPEYCYFYDRCLECLPICKQKYVPELLEIEDGHKVACHISEENNDE